jgi:signal transduction histidine kinase
VPVTVGVEGEIRPLPPAATVALLRTAQESLVNAAKHSVGQPIEIRLTYSPGQTALTVTNPLGPGRAAGHLSTVDGGYGLVGMRERLLMLDGTLTAGRSNGQWTVTAQVPR